MSKQRFLLGSFVCLALTGITCAPRDDDQGKPEPKVPAGPAKVEDGPATKNDAKLSSTDLAFRDRLDAVRRHIRQRLPLTTDGFWTVFHHILGIGPENAYLFDTRTGNKVKAIDHICAGKSMEGLWFEENKDGSVLVKTLAGTGTGQGHQDQFVAEMVQWGMKKNKAFIVNGNKHDFFDFVRSSRMEASLTKNQELSWAVLIIGEHFGTDHRWTNRFGESLSLEDVIRYEIKEPIGPMTTCGGTHRLFDLTWVYHRHRQKGGKKEGVWKDLVDYLDKYKKLAREYQHMDGTFSTKYVSERDDNPDVKLRINSTGHVLEWLAMALPDQELREPWMREAANQLIDMIMRNPRETFDGGTLYHAAHGLALYRTRMFGPSDAHPPLFPPVPRD